MDRTVVMITSQNKAPEGAHHWINQRLSAIALIPTAILFLLWLLAYGSDPYAEIIASLSSPWVSALLFIFISLASYHAMLGIQVIIEDYIHDSFWRSLLLIKTKLFGMLLPILTLFLLIRIMVLGMKL